LARWRTPRARRGTATGVTLQYRNPELKERSFEVAGTTITLSELTKVCSAQSKALRGK
jgi:hypothetical protein